MANIKLKDFVTAENDLDGQEYAYISQIDKTRKTTLQKIKEFILGTTEMGTDAIDVTGAVKEINDKIGSTEKEGSVIAQLNERAIKTYYNLSQIGLTDSNLAGKTQNEIADIIINAMPNNSTLELYLSGTTTTNIGILLPIKYDGILRIYKDTIKGCRFSFVTQTNRIFDSFYASWKSPTLSGWQEVSFNTKTPIMVTPGIGKTILYNDTFKINNKIFINLRYKNTDNSVLTPGEFSNHFSLPNGLINKIFVAKANGLHGTTWSAQVNVTHNTTGSFLITIIEQCNEIIVTGEVEL